MRRHHHDQPLVEFTSLAIGGAGLAGVAAAAVPDVTMAWPFVATGAGLLAAGVLRSLGHLGRRTRAPQAWRGMGRSPLTHEILLAMLLLGSCGLMLALAATGRPTGLLRAPTAVLAAAFLVSIGFVYRLPGQPAWRGAAAWTPLTAGLAFGAIAITSFAATSLRLPMALPPVPRTIALGAVALDTLTFLLRCVALRRIRLAAARIDPPDWFAHPIAALATRVVLLDVVPAASIMLGPAPLFVFVAALGLWVDRSSFYALTAPHSTEAEIARVELLIE